MRKILKNTAKTKKYLDSLPKIYAVFLWASWAIVEVPWSGTYNKEHIPLVYNYFDFNGEYDEYRLVPVNQISSGTFYDWFNDDEYAKYILNKLNSKES